MSTSYDEKLKIWSGPKVPFPFAKNVTVGEVILKNLDKTPDRVTQISDDDGIELTCNELKLLSIRAAQNLMKLGLKKGDIVGFMAKNSTYMTPVIFGSFLAGIAVNPLDPTYNKIEISHMFQQTQPKVVFCDADQLAFVLEALKEIHLNPKVYTLNEKAAGFEHVDEILKETGEENLFTDPDFGDSSELIAAILCSSGTIALSKAVTVSHASFLSNLALLKNEEVIGTLHPGSISWISSFLALINAACCLNVRIITTKPITAETLVSLIHKHKVTQFFASTRQASLFVETPIFQNTDLSTIKTVYMSGGRPSIDLMRKLKKCMPNAQFLVVYAMTEGANAVSLAVDGSSKGKLFYNITVKIVDEEGNQLGLNESGEILVKFLFPFKGYFNNPKANESAFDAEGFYKTGDMGYFDDEGYLCFMDRKSDIIQYLGYKISPFEIEVFIQKIDGVREVSVVGFLDESLNTDVIAAMIIKNEGSQLKESQVIDKIERELPDYKRLRGGVYFIDHFPLTTTGKVKKRILKQTAAELYSDSKSEKN